MLKSFFRRRWTLRLTVVIGAAVGASMAALLAFSYFSATTTAEANTVAAATLPQGATPSVSVVGSDVQITFDTVSVDSTEIQGYDVLRYTGNTATSVAISGTCSISDGTVTCTDSPGNGTWRYTDTPKYNSWVGIESDKSDLVSPVTDHDPPVVTLATASGDYSSSGTTYDGEIAWANGTIHGTANDTGGSGLASVAVSIRQVDGGKYWDGSGFTSAVQVWNTATGTTSWSLPFPPSNFPDGGAYTITAQATDGASNTTPTSSRTVNVDYDQAHTLFVSTSGSDSTGDGGLGSPYASIAKALSETQPSAPLNVIAVAVGNYPSTVTIAGPVTDVIIRGGYDSSSWLRSAPGSNTVTITGDGNGGDPNTASRVGVYVPAGFSPNLEQLTIESGDPSGPAGSAYGVLADGGSRAEVRPRSRTPLSSRLRRSRARCGDIGSGGLQRIRWSKCQHRHDHRLLAARRRAPAGGTAGVAAPPLAGQ